VVCSGTLPRIAVVGNTSNVTTSRPAQNLLHAAGFPFATFTDEAAAKAWLLRKKKAMTDRFARKFIAYAGGLLALVEECVSIIGIGAVC
jgi:hypothetical protein